MSRETCITKPQEVEVFPLDKGTDIILRKNIEKVTQEDEEGKTYTAYECDELQCRTIETVTTNDVTENFDAWWAYAENYKAQAYPDNEPTASGITFSDRLDAMEAAIMEIAEVITNG